MAEEAGDICARKEENYGEHQRLQLSEGLSGGIEIRPL